MLKHDDPFLLVAVFAAFLVGCSQSEHPSTSVAPSSDPVVAFDTGQGTGTYDAMTYLKYASEIALTPSSNMTVRSIRPEMWYCNGTSGFLAFIRDSHGSPLAAEAGLVDGSGSMRPTFGDRYFDAPIRLMAGTTYSISMEVWTTKSVGIFTTGSRTTGSVGAGSYVINSASIIDRGAIAFQLTE